MNKQIRALAEQSGFPAKRTFSDLSDLYPRLEKFAELIVRECMGVVSSKCASPTAYNALAEHFGVEQ